MVHIYNGILPSHKKTEVMPFAATWIRPRDDHAERSKYDRERQIDDITCMWNLRKVQMNLFTNQK